jgi:hypothetical protein
LLAASRRQQPYQQANSQYVSFKFQFFNFIFARTTGLKDFFLLTIDYFHFSLLTFNF